MPRCRPLPWLASLALLALLAVADAPAKPKIPGMDDGPDAFNLGNLGAEGLPLDKGEVKGFALPDGGAAVKLLTILPGTLAERSGLVVGDILVSIGTAPVAKKPDPIYFVVEAIERATQVQNCVLDFGVLRDGKKISVKVKPDFLGKHSTTCPGKCTRCDRLIVQSLDYLAKAQAGDGSFEVGIGSQNGKVVVTSLAGLAFLAAGGSTTGGPCSEQIQKCLKFVLENVGKEDDFMGLGGRRGRGGEDGGGAGGGAGGNWNQINWQLGYAPLFLAECYRRTPDPAVKQKLEEIKDAILRNQEASGGWAHGPGGPNALGYVELEIMSNFCLAALGMMQQIGIKVPAEPVKKALAFIEDTSEGDGGVGYSPRPGQKGNGDPGRTAGAIFAFSLLGQRNHPFFPKMVGFFERTIRDIPHGHVSPVMHFLNAAIACCHLDPKEWQKLTEIFLLEFLAARRPDGSFSARPTEESVALHSNTDRELGPAWTTASYLIVLQIRKGGLPVLAGAKKR